MKTPLFFIQIVLASCLILSGCQKKGADEKKPSTLHFSIQQDLSTLDPRKAGDLATATIHFLLFEGLTRLKSDGTTEPAQSKTINISSDGLRYTFILRDTYWSDGTKITAHDYERSWKTLLSPEFPSSNAHLLYPIVNAEAAKKGLISLDQVGIKAVDDQTLVVELQKQAPYFLEIVCFSSFHPVKKDAPILGLKDLVVNGPYLLKEWKFNSSLTLEKNPHYWDKETIKTDKILVSIINNENTLLNMFEKKQLDFIGGPLAPFPTAAISTLMKDKRLKVQPVAGSTVCFFNTHAFPFHNEDMRKAFAFAISRSEIVKNITQMGEIPASSMIPPILKTGKTSVTLDDGNAEVARAHFEKALKDLDITAKDLDGITYIYSGRQEHHQIAQFLQQQWKKVLGVNIALQSYEHKVLIEKMSSRDFHFGQTIWMAQFNDPRAILERFKDASCAKNYCRWEDSTFSHLLEQSYHIYDSRRRHMVLEEAEKILLEELPLMPLYHWSYAFLIHENVKNVSFSSLGSINLTEIVVEEENPPPYTQNAKETFAVSKPL